MGFYSHTTCDVIGAMDLNFADSAETGRGSEFDRSENLAGP